MNWLLVLDRVSSRSSVLCLAFVRVYTSQLKDPRYGFTQSPENEAIPKKYLRDAVVEK